MGSKFNIFAQVKIVHFIREAHHIVGNKLIRCSCAKDLRLKLVKFDYQIRTKPFPIKHSGRVFTNHSDFGCLNVVKIWVILTPKHGAPITVEILNIAVLFPKPVLKPQLTTWAITKIIVTVAKLIVNLPTNYIWILTKVVCKRYYIAFYMFLPASLIYRDTIGHRIICHKSAACSLL